MLMQSFRTLLLSSLLCGNVSHLHNWREMVSEGFSGLSGCLEACREEVFVVMEWIVVEGSD